MALVLKKIMAGAEPAEAERMKNWELKRHGCEVGRCLHDIQSQVQVGSRVSNPKWNHTTGQQPLSKTNSGKEAISLEMFITHTGSILFCSPRRTESILLNTAFLDNVGFMVFVKQREEWIAKPNITGNVFVMLKWNKWKQFRPENALQEWKPKHNHFLLKCRGRSTSKSKEIEIQNLNPINSAVEIKYKLLKSYQF